ncbi:MAG TPA: AraC family transcriptional regulator [Flavobacteriaceae bacterium]|nr:AraC family transcriptional regulator [Flavobacteriaceae bacterium]|tara:strand:- start:178289 stop:179137 length:849 start_codon:yes stop_codon:yes gene_type:complete
MKVLPFTIPKPKNDALILQEDKQPLFYNLFHQHEEIQLSVIKKGEGSLIVGDAVHSFQAGELIVLGSNVPHVFKSTTLKDSPSHMLTVFFKKDSFGNDFFETEELKSLDSFFEKATQSFKISDSSEEIIASFEALFSVSKLERFILFLQLLKAINESLFIPLSSFAQTKKYSDNEGRRMGIIYNFSMNHFREKITLPQIASEAAMTPQAFCRYFKKRTRKTYIEFLNEIRIEEACNLLKKHPEMSIIEIAESSGFNNISNFHRKFKEQKGLRPLQYQKQSQL